MRNRFTSSYIDGPIGSTMLRTACSMLAGPLVAAAAAVTGVISDPREVFNL